MFYFQKTKHSLQPLFHDAVTISNLSRPEVKSEGNARRPAPWLRLVTVEVIGHLVPWDGKPLFFGDWIDTSTRSTAEQCVRDEAEIVQPPPPEIKELANTNGTPA